MSIIDLTLICTNITYRYHRRKLLALQNKEKYLSMIMDGMDQSHSKFPHLPKKDFKAPLKMHVQGVLEHGYGKKFLNHCILK